MSVLAVVIADVTLRFIFDAPALARFFADYFRYYLPAPSHEVPTHAELTLELISCDSLPVRKGQSESVAHTGRLNLWRWAEAHQVECFWLETGTAAFRLEPAAGRGVGYLTPAALAAPGVLANTDAACAWLLLLRQLGVYHLHAAAVLMPDGRLGLLPGPARAGKTTLATALGLAGWRPLADDSLLLDTRGETVSLAPLRKDFHPDEKLLLNWPGLAQAEVCERAWGRAYLSALELFGTRALAERSFTQVNWIVLPQISDQPKSRLEPLSHSAALLTLAEQSMFFQLWPGHTECQFQALAALTRRAACYRLHCGRDILLNPQAAARVLARM